jgi:hypothetical protein
MHHTNLPVVVGKLGAMTLQLFPFTSHQDGNVPDGVETIIPFTFNGFVTFPKLKTNGLTIGLAGGTFCPYILLINNMIMLVKMYFRNFAMILAIVLDYR